MPASMVFRWWSTRKGSGTGASVRRTCRRSSNSIWWEGVRWNGCACRSRVSGRGAVEGRGELIRHLARQQRQDASSTHDVDDLGCRPPADATPRRGALQTDRGVTGKIHVPVGGRYSLLAADQVLLRGGMDEFLNDEAPADSILSSPLTELGPVEVHSVGGPDSLLETLGPSRHSDEDGLPAVIPGAFEHKSLRIRRDPPDGIADRVSLRVGGGAGAKYPRPGNGLPDRR